ncbi:MAG: hypothetical protein Q9217_001617 [Psora testacea]
MTLSTFNLSLDTPGGLLKLLFFVLALSSLSSFVLSAPTADSSVAVSSPNNENRHHEQREALPHPAANVDKPEVITSLIDESSNLLKRSGGAGLQWGPVCIGNLKLSLTKPHNGAPHVNFHIDKKDPGPRGTYSEVVNTHTVKYESGGRNCLFAWDSVNQKTVFDSCFDDFNEAIQKYVSAIKAFVDTLLQNADFIAPAAIIAALVVALTVGSGALAVA